VPRAREAGHPRDAREAGHPRDKELQDRQAEVDQVAEAVAEAQRLRPTLEPKT
jgi:hypothetical protein